MTCKQTLEEVKEQVIRFTCGDYLRPRKKQVQRPFCVQDKSKKASVQSVEKGRKITGSKR